MRCLIICLLCMLSGCSSITFNDLFNDYASQLTPVRNAIKNNDLAAANNALCERTLGSSSYLLNQLEQARIAQLKGDGTQALHAYEKVYQAMQSQQQAAKYQLSAGLAQTQALLTNDSALDYLPHNYEMSMLHSFKALNYIYDHDLSAALVEVRRANLVQQQALQSKQTELDQAQAVAQQHYPGMENIIGSVKNGFQNAYTFYLSALLYQANKQYDDAYIDYKKAYEIMPNNPYLQQDLLRLAKQQGFNQDLKRYSQAFPPLQAIGAAEGEVIIMLEQGLVPSQVEFKLRMPIDTSSGNIRFYSLALPVYKDMPYNDSMSHLMLDQKMLKLSPLVNLEALAARTLKDEMPAKITRQILRLISKEKIRTEMARSNGELGNIIANLYNLASEQADTRSWNTLPNNISLIRQPLAAGEHRLQLPDKSTVKFNVSKQGLTLIYITSISNYLNYHVVQL